MAWAACVGDALALAEQLTQRGRDRRAIQKLRAQHQWDQLEMRSMLGQRLDTNSEAAYVEVACEMGLQVGEVRLWHKCWAAVMLGPVKKQSW